MPDSISSQSSRGSLRSEGSGYSAGSQRQSHDSPPRSTQSSQARPEGLSSRSSSLASASYRTAQNRTARTLASAADSLELARTRLGTSAPSSASTAASYRTV